VVDLIYIEALHAAAQADAMHRNVHVSTCTVCPQYPKIPNPKARCRQLPVDRGARPLAAGLPALRAAAHRRERCDREGVCPTAAAACQAAPPECTCLSSLCARLP
jgi:hypothetical protein